jgi:hypothetical protein
MNFTVTISDRVITNAYISAAIGYWGARSGRRVKDGDGTVYNVTDTKLMRAMSLLAADFNNSDSFARIMADRADTHDGDLLIQYACFGELKYG